MTRVVILKSRIGTLGGLERYAMMLAQAFSNKGCDVTILTTEEPIELKGVEVISFNKTTRTNLGAIKAFEKNVAHWLDTHSYDVVFGLDRTTYQTHYRAGNGLHQTFLKQKTRNTISQLWYKVSQKHKLIKNIERTLFTSSNLKLLFTNSKMVQKELMDAFDLPKEQVKVVYNGVDFDKFTLCDEALQSTAAQPKTCQLLFVGHNYDRKGLMPLLYALKKQSDWNFHLNVVGRDKNIAKYKKCVQKFNLENKVSFLGPLKDLQPIYLQSDVFFLPTFYDPFANVTIEALAMGLFVVTSKHNGGHEILNEETGFVLNDVNAIESFEEAFQKLKSVKFDYAARLQRRRSILHLDINNQLNKMVELTLNSLSS